MSVHQRPDSPNKPWVVRWRADGRHRSAGFRTRREAVQFDAEVQRAAGQRVAPVASAVPLRVWLGEWMRVHGPTWAPSTLRGRAVYCDKWIAPYLGDVPLGQLGRGDVSRWRAAMLRDGASADTVNHAHRVLSAALGRAVDEGVLAGNPCSGIRALRHRVERPRALTGGEVEAVLAAAINGRDRRLIALMAYAGLRPGEAIALRWGDVGDTLLHVDRSVRIDGSVSTPKSGRGRTVPVSKSLAVILGSPGPEPSLVCPRLDTDGHLQWRAWYRHQWKPIRERAAVACAPYDLRHTYASHLIAQGRSVVEVAAWMGHSDPSLTLRRYAHLFASVHHVNSQHSTAPRTGDS